MLVIVMYAAPDDAPFGVARAHGWVIWMVPTSKSVAIAPLEIQLSAIVAAIADVTRTDLAGSRVSVNGLDMTSPRTRVNVCALTRRWRALALGVQVVS